MSDQNLYLGPPLWCNNATVSVKGYSNSVSGEVLLAVSATFVMQPQFIQANPNFGQTLWTPLALGASLKAWFVKGSNNTYTDSSGNGHTFTGPDSNGQYASDTNLVVPQPMYYAAAYSEGSSPNPYEILFAGDASNANSSRAIVFTRYNNGAPQMLGGTGNAPFGPGAISAGAPHGLITFFNGASSLASVDGVQYTSLSTGSAGIINGFRTGGGDSGSYFNGPLPTNILIISGTLSSDDTLRLEGWLARNGGGALTAAHPYYSSAPTTGPVPVVVGTLKAQITSGSNQARFGVYSGVGATNQDGSSAIPPTPTLFGKNVQAVKVFGSNSAQKWSGDTSNGETVESSILYSLGLLKGRNLQINLTIPLATGSNAYYQFPGMALTDVVAGSADTMFTNVANYLINNGFANDPNAPLMLVYAQEQNGSWFPWASDGSAAWNTNYLAACRRMHDVMKPLFTAANKYVMFGNAWNKGKPGLPWQALEKNYPGDAYCDFIGMDVYDDDLDYNNPQGFGTNASVSANTRFQTSVLGTVNDYRLTWLDIFARTPNMRGPGFIDKTLPIVIGEWAAGGPTSIQGTDFARGQAYAGNDDGTYMAGMLKWFKDHNVYEHFFYDIFDTSIGYTGAVKWTHENTGMSANGYGSNTLVAISTGSKTYTVASGLPFVVSMPLIIIDTGNANNFLEATVTSYSNTSLTVNAFAVSGNNTPNSVTIKTHPTCEMPNSYAAIKAA